MMVTPLIKEWLKNVREPSARLLNILSRICDQDDIAPDKITKERFLREKGAGIMSWGELVNLKTGIDQKIMYDRINTKPRYPEIQTGKLWSVDGEIYELFDMRVTAPESPTVFTTCAFFKSRNPKSNNPVFEERISVILSQPEIFKPHFEDSKKPKKRTLPKRIAYTVGKSNKVKWFDIGDTLKEFLSSKDGRNHVQYYYPFQACFARFIKGKIKGINTLSAGQYGTLEEYLKSLK